MSTPCWHGLDVKSMMVSCLLGRSRWLTKAKSCSVWTLISDGLLDINEPVAHYLPEFGANGKEAVTVERWGMAGAGVLIA